MFTIGPTTRLTTAAVVAGALFVAGCSSSPSHPVADPATRGQQAASAIPGNSGQSEDDPIAFCHALARAGLVNTAALGDSGDPRRMLNALESLVSTAPDDIAADFAVFVRVENSTLDPTTASGSTDLANPGTGEALAHVAKYLQRTCHLT